MILDKLVKWYRSQSLVNCLLLKITKRLSFVFISDFILFYLSERKMSDFAPGKTLESDDQSERSQN